MRQVVYYVENKNIVGQRIMNCPCWRPDPADCPGENSILATEKLGSRKPTKIIATSKICGNTRKYIIARLVFVR